MGFLAWILLGCEGIRNISATENCTSCPCPLHPLVKAALQRSFKHCSSARPSALSSTDSRGLREFESSKVDLLVLRLGSKMSVGSRTKEEGIIFTIAVLQKMVLPTNPQVRILVFTGVLSRVV